MASTISSLSDIRPNSSSSIVLRRHRWVVQTALILSLAVAVAIVTAVARNAERRKSVPTRQAELIGYKGLDTSSERGLSTRYMDRDKDLLADRPSASTEFIDPATLVLAHYVGDDIGKGKVDWNALRVHLEKHLKKPVLLQPFQQNLEQIEAVASGKVHLVTAHAADVPTLVNDAGLVPFSVLGSADGADGNRLVIAVPKDSSAQSLVDLRSKSLICTDGDSITGYRAAIVAIASEVSLEPNVDYGILFSKTQERSVTVLSVGQIDFAAISNDTLSRMEADHKISGSEYRILYKSQVIPRITAGHVHNLSPELVSKIEHAFLTFKNMMPVGEAESSDPSHDSPATAPTGFIRIKYLDDFAFLRAIDAAFVTRFALSEDVVSQ